MANITITLDSGESYELGNLLPAALLPCVASFAPAADMATPEGRAVALKATCEGIFYWLRNQGIVFARQVEVAAAEAAIQARITEVDAAAMAAATINGEPLIPTPPGGEGQPENQGEGA